MDAFTTRLGSRTAEKPPLKQKSTNALADVSDVVRFPSQACLDAIAQRKKKKSIENESVSDCHIREIKKKFPSILGPIQQIRFSEPFISTDYKLFEIDKRLLQEIEQHEEQLIIRGRMSDFVVACTSTRTFQVKECESSNSIMLLPGFGPRRSDGSGDCQEKDEADGYSVVSISNTYMEMTEITSTFSTRLREILNEHCIELFNTDEDDNHESPQTQITPVTWDYLLSEVQLSEGQLRNRLKKFAVLDCDDGFYLLSRDSQRRILDAIVELCDDFSVPRINVGKIDREELIERLPFIGHLKAPIAEWFLEYFCDETEDPDYFSINEQKLCRARASEVLCSDKKRDFPVELFKRLVERILPDNVECRLDCLQGIAYFDKNLVTGETVRSLEVADLPDGPRERLGQLFAMKHMWKKAEIEPYVLDYCSGPLEVEEFLMKHCRIVRKGDEKFFTLRPL